MFSARWAANLNFCEYGGQKKNHQADQDKPEGISAKESQYAKLTKKAEKAKN